MKGIGSGMELAVAGDGVVVAPFGQALVDVARTRTEIVGMSADLAKYTDMLPFAEAYPDRFFNAGMAEQNMVGVAAGMAAEGLLPVVTTYGVFATRRALDFLVVQGALMRRNLKLVAGLPGLTTGYGGTHQAIEDLAVMRTVPGLVVLDPADAVELDQATRAMLEYDGPVYMRLQRGSVPVQLPPGLPPFEIGRSRLVAEGTDVGIVACGVMVGRALEAAEQLAAEGLSVAVLDAASIKPFDEEAVVALAQRCGRLVTAENHLRAGGLYSLVCETLVTHGAAVPVRAVALQDTFGGYGSLPYLAERYGLTAGHIAAAGREVSAA